MNRYQATNFAAIFLTSLGCDRSGRHLSGGNEATSKPSSPVSKTRPAKPSRPVGFALHDDFENATIADFWMPGDHGSGRYEPGAVHVDDNLARSGDACVRITLREGDIAQIGADGTHHERAELDSGKHRLIGRTVRYQYAVRIPQEFPIVPTRLVIAQWKQKRVRGGPLIAVRFRRGIHHLTIRKLGESENARHYFALPPLTPAVWHDMIVTIRYATDATGFIRVMMNGKEAARFDGPTAMPDHDPRFYNKFGLYRDRMEQPMTIYYDDYSMEVVE